MPERRVQAKPWAARAGLGQGESALPTLRRAQLPRTRLPSLSSTVNSTAMPAMNNTITTLTPTRCEPDHTVSSPKQERPDERCQLAGECEEAEELVLHVLRDEPRHQRTARRLIRAGKDADQDARRPERSLRCSRASRAAWRRSARSTTTMIVRLPPIRSSRYPIANAPMPAVEIDHDAEHDDLLQRETESLRRVEATEREHRDEPVVEKQACQIETARSGDACVAPGTCGATARTMRATTPPPRVTRDLSSCTQSSIGRVNTANHTATTRFVARMFSPSCLVNPNQGCSGCTSVTRQRSNASRPPMYPSPQPRPDMKPMRSRGARSGRNAL